MDAALCAPNVPFGKQRQTNDVHVSLLMSWTKAKEDLILVHDVCFLFHVQA